MRLTHLRAENFLSFSDLAVEDLDHELTVIVGPNGAGKTNVVRMIQLAMRVLAWTNDSQPGDLARQYAGAVNWQAQSQAFNVSVGIQLTTDAECEMLRTWLRAALLSSYARGHQERVESADTHLMSAVDDQTADMLATASIAIQFEALPTPRFSVGYEFAVGDQTFCYVIRAAGGQGGIARGSLAEHLQHETQNRDRSRLLTDDPADDPPSLDFNQRRLLPGEDEFIDLDIQEVYGWRRTETDREFRRVFDALAEDRSYMLDLFLTRVLSQVVFVGDDRTSARERYHSSELMLPSSTGGMQDTPQELLRLKLGDADQRRRFQRAQEHFASLSGASFDLHLLPAAAPARDEEGPLETHFAIQVEVTDGPFTVPLSFAGAGRWEALILSRALASEGTVTILDEPALNLHPTLQRRLLRAIKEGDSQTLLITHSPFLVPADSQREIQKIIRLRRDQAQTTAHRVASAGIPTLTGAQGIKLHQTFVNSTDARALLFASAALLVEGPTEVAIAEVWLPALAATHDLPSPQDLNLAIISANGDGSLALHAAYLDAFAVPWAILCDGKALRLDCQKSLKKLLPDTHTQGLPAPTADFEDVRAAWESKGVFTLVRDFKEEIETYMDRIDATAWQQVTREREKKPHRGRLFAERVRPPEEFSSLYTNVLRHLGLLWSGAPEDSSFESKTRT